VVAIWRPEDDFANPAENGVIKSVSKAQRALPVISLFGRLVK
jgi:hypothetical protein